MSSAEAIGRDSVDGPHVAAGTGTKPMTPTTPSVGSTGATLTTTTTVGGAGGAATANTWCRLVDWLNRFKIVMKDSPLTVLGLSTRRNPKVSEIIDQAKIICEDYVYGRLLTSGCLSETEQEAGHQEVGKQSDVSREIQLIGARLEASHPQLYQNVSKQVNLPLRTDSAVRRTLTSVGDFLFKHGTVTWARVIALLAVCAAVAMETVQLNRPDLIGVVVGVFADVVERHVAVWICRQGGWSEIMKAFRLNKETRNLWALTGLGTVAGFVFTWMTAMQI